MLSRWIRVASFPQNLLKRSLKLIPTGADKRNYFLLSNGSIVKYDTDRDNWNAILTFPQSKSTEYAHDDVHSLCDSGSSCSLDKPKQILYLHSHFTVVKIDL